MAVDEEAGRVVGPVEVEGGVAGELDHGVSLILVGGVDAAVEGLGGEAAVHRPGVEEVEAEAGGEAAGDGGLARPGRPVEGDDEPLHGGECNRWVGRGAARVKAGSARPGFSVDGAMTLLPTALLRHDAPALGEPPHHDWLIADPARPGDPAALLVDGAGRPGVGRLARRTE